MSTVPPADPLAAARADPWVREYLSSLDCIFVLGPTGINAGPWPFPTKAQKQVLLSPSATPNRLHAALHRERERQQLPNASVLSVAEARRSLTDTVDLISEWVTADARECATAGHLFVINKFDIDRFHQQHRDAIHTAHQAGLLRLPYPRMAVIVASTLAATIVVMMEDGPPIPARNLDPGAVLLIRGAFGYHSPDGSPVWVPDRIDELDREKKSAAATVFLTTLYAVLHCRTPARHVVVDEKLNRARLRRGRPPIPPYWELTPTETLIRPPVIDEDDHSPKGGIHASPREHSRRGHWRHLHDGRTIWVRDAVVNALANVLTRNRAFYEVRL
jgi:hypothetical protein